MAQTDTETRNYEVCEFYKIITHGGGNLQIHYSDKYSLQVKANNACGELVKTSVSAKTLCEDNPSSDPIGANSKSMENSEFDSTNGCHIDQVFRETIWIEQVNR